MTSVADGRGIYERILDDLIHGRLIGGTKLPEPILVGHYGGSRTPVREALVRLEAEGLVERASRGYRVRVGRAADILDIYEARIALEAIAAQGASLRHTDLERARLVRVHEESLATTDNAHAQELHSQWHRMLWAASHNATVTTLLNTLSHQLRVLDRGNTVRHPDNASTNDDHGALLEAIVNRDPVAAGEAATAHMIRTREMRIENFAKLDYL